MFLFFPLPSLSKVNKTYLNIYNLLSVPYLFYKINMYNQRQLAIANLFIFLYSNFFLILQKYLHLGSILALVLLVIKYHKLVD